LLQIARSTGLIITPSSGPLFDHQCIPATTTVLDLKKAYYISEQGNEYVSNPNVDDGCDGFTGAVVADACWLLPEVVTWLSRTILNNGTTKLRNDGASIVAYGVTNSSNLRVYRSFFRERK